MLPGMRAIVENTGGFLGNKVGLSSFRAVSVRVHPILPRFVNAKLKLAKVKARQGLRVCGPAMDRSPSVRNLITEQFTGGNETQRFRAMKSKIEGGSHGAGMRKPGGPVIDEVGFSRRLAND